MDIHTKNWWYCDNIIDHPGQIGLLSFNDPNVFVLVRDADNCYFAEFEEFKNNIAEVNFLHPADRQNADIESILVDAWNFMLLAEDADEIYLETHAEDADENW